MTIREQMERQELEMLSPAATLACRSKGRLKQEEPCDVRTDFQRDRDRILHSKAFRRLKDKTQVFLSPRGDHYRTRLTHTLEVSQLSRTVAKALNLNVDLVEAIALGHDLGHTPFGHAGERILNRLHPDGFRHNEQSLRVVDTLEKDGEGLNLTWEVRDGILNHQTASMPATPEGQIVRICDKIAYIHHDMDDAKRAGIISEDDIPITIRMTLGTTTKGRLNTLIHDLIKSSMQQNKICQSEQVGEAMQLLRKVMFQDVYTNPAAKSEETKVDALFRALFDYYMNSPQALPKAYRAQEEDKIEQNICDFISGMTDQYCIRSFEKIFVPKSWDKV